MIKKSKNKNLKTKICHYVVLDKSGNIIFCDNLINGVKYPNTLDFNIVNEDDVINELKIDLANRMNIEESLITNIQYITKNSKTNFKSNQEHSIYIVSLNISINEYPILNSEDEKILLRYLSFEEFTEKLSYSSIYLEIISCLLGVVCQKKK